MKQVLLRSAIIAAAAIAAFALGRAWPRSGATAAAGSEPAMRDEAPAASRSTSRAVRGGSLPSRSAARDTGTDFDRVMRDDVEGAANLRSEVVVTVSERRRRRQPALRACLDSGELEKDALLRFSVDVHAADGRAEVGPAVIVDVLEGPPVSDAALACLLAAMDERETIELGSSVSYDGAIDVPIRFVAVRAP